MNEFLQHLVNGLSMGTIYALIALGYTMVYGVLKLINFAHSDVVMLGSFFAYYVGRKTSMFSSKPYTAALAFAAAMAGCALLGFVIERLAYKPLRKRPRLTALITAIGISLLLENGGQNEHVFGAAPRFFPTLIPKTPLFTIGEVSISTLQVFSFGVAVALMVGLQLLVYKTRVGMAMRAISYDSAVASLMGVNVDGVISLTFMIGSALAGAAGVLYAAAYPSIDPMMGLIPGLKAFVAAVLGGIGNVPGAMAGGLLMGLAEELVAGYASSSFKDAVAFGILILILLFRPAGLFGKLQAEKV